MTLRCDHRQFHRFMYASKVWYILFFCAAMGKKPVGIHYNFFLIKSRTKQMRIYLRISCSSSEWTERKKNHKKAVKNVRKYNPEIVFNANCFILIHFFSSVVCQYTVCLCLCQRILLRWMFKKFVVLVLVCALDFRISFILRSCLLSF